MNTYEALLVFKPILDVENSDGVLKNLENTIQNLKGKILKLDKVGRKRLAYEIAKFKDGYIAAVLMEMEPSAVADFKKACQLNEDILRLTLVRQSEESLAAISTTTTTVSGPSYGTRETRDHHRGDRGERGERGGFSDFRRDRGPRPPREGGYREGGPREGGMHQGPRGGGEPSREGAPEARRAE